MWTVLPDAVFCDRRPCNAALEEKRAAGKLGEKPSTPARTSRRETRPAKVVSTGS